MSVYLLRTEGENSRSKFLRKFTPLEIQGGSNLAPIAIQLDAAELQHAIVDGCVKARDSGGLSGGDDPCSDHHRHRGSRRLEAEAA